MSVTIATLEPTVLFKHFAALVATPRGSGKEERARDYVLEYARKLGCEARVDGVGNVVVYVPASPGREAAPRVALQGHMDIVCEKHPSVAHDFDADPIPAYIDGDYIRAKGTTLGADNGIGLAAALAVAEDPSSVHGPLDLLFTVDEETGLTGASNLTPDFVKGRILLNLDSEDEGVIFIGCAGGGDSQISIPVERMSVPMDHVAVTVRVEGLKGGHSGLEINAGRGNALRILARAVTSAIDPDELLLACVSGGNKRNAIPRDASAVVFVPKDHVDRFADQVAGFWRLIKEELGTLDPGVKVSTLLEPANLIPINRRQSGRIARLLLALPHGPLAMSQEIPGLVETSSNLAVVGTTETEVNVLCNSRSSVRSCLDAVREGIRACGKLAGGVVTLSGQYPGWRPNMASPVLAVARRTWTEFSGKEASVTAIHAGLECGVIGERIAGMDMISFGPTMRGVHSPDEELSIGSSGRFYGFLKALLAAVSA